MLLNLLAGTDDMSSEAGNNQEEGVGGTDGPFARLVGAIKPMIPAISDVFLTIAVVALICCFGMLTISGQQKVQQIKGHLVRIMIGAAGVLAAAYLVGFFAKTGGQTIGAGKNGGFSQGSHEGETTIAPAVKFYASSIFPNL